MDRRTPCGNRLSFAYTRYINHEIVFNKSHVLYSSIPARVYRPDPVFYLADCTIHERHHQVSPNPFNPPITRLVETERIIFDRAYGATIVESSQSSSQSCIRNLGMEADEASIQEDTNFLLSELGINPSPTRAYEDWVERYKNNLLPKLQPEDRITLLGLRQYSRAIQFFTLIGNRFGFSGERAEIEGRNQAINIILGRS